MSKQEEVAAPAHLSKGTQRIWREIARRRCRSSERRIALTAACEMLDRAVSARRAVKRHGVVYKTKTGILHGNPAVALELQARRAFIRAWKDLGLHWNPEIDGRILHDDNHDDGLN